MSAADDRHAIETLIAIYAERVDLGDFAAVGSLFEGATYRAVQGDEIVTYDGAAAVEEVLETLVRTYEDGTPRTKHVMSNVSVTVDGDVGSARLYFTVFQQVEAGRLHAIVAGRYHDQFARIDGQWRFVDRLIFSDLVGDVSGHLAVDVFGDGA
jgi:ketosteroid isomerase-like protein